MIGRTRREVLTALCGGTGWLAGCSGWPTSRSSPTSSDCRSGASAPNEILGIEITDIRRNGDGFAGTVRVRNTFEWGGYTHYEGVAFVAYDQDANRIRRRHVGQIGPDDEWTEPVEFERFPFVITADADHIEVTDPSGCWRPATGAEVRGYVGHYEPGDRLPTRSAGHVWEYLDTRAVGRYESEDFERNQLPLGPSHFRITKCRVRNYDRIRRIQSPDLSLLPDASWVDERIAPDHRSTSWVVEHGLGWPTDGGDSGGTPTAVEFRDVPEPLRRTVTGEALGEIDREEFLALLGTLEGRSFDGVRSLPSCTRDHVQCSDDRWSNCLTGEYEWSRGSLTYRAAYAVEYRGETHRFVFVVEDSW